MYTDDLQHEVQRMEAVCVQDVQAADAVMDAVERPEWKRSHVQQPMAGEAAHLAEDQSRHDSQPQRLRRPPAGKSRRERAGLITQRARRPESDEPTRPIISEGEHH